MGGVRLRERRHLRARASSGNGDINTICGRRRRAPDRPHARRPPVRVHRIQGRLRQRRRRLQAARADDDGLRGLRRGPVVRRRARSVSATLDYSTNRNIALGAATRTGVRRRPAATTTSRACSAATGSSTGTGTTARSPSSRGRRSSCASSAKTAATAPRSRTTSRRTTRSWSSLGWQVAGNLERLPSVRARHVGVQLRRRHAIGDGQVEHARGNVHRARIHAGRQLVAVRRGRQPGTSAA